ncbi:hypothetical protein HY989_04170 [Candidatus Micrarchaeota archaeon]|nr:hypothetical protein [Candidatus Micrarchaeota archaeon]
MQAVHESYGWLATHGKELDKYAGKWVAVVKGGLLAVANSPKELFKLDKVKEAKDALITKIPYPEEAYSLL